MQVLLPPQLFLEDTSSVRLVPDPVDHAQCCVCRWRPQRSVSVLNLQQDSRCVESVRRSSADWRDVTPEQDALLQQHTIQTEHRRKKSWTRRGKLICLLFLTRRTLSGLFEPIRVFNSRRPHFWQISGTWMVFAPIGTSFRLLSRVC